VLSKDKNNAKLLSSHSDLITFHSRNFYKLWVIAFLLILNSTARAVPVDIAQLASFINATELGSYSLEDTQIGSGFNDFAGAGLDSVFSNGLDANNLGTVTWQITNNTGFNLTNVNYFGFLDAEITEPGNSFFNEYGSLINVSGTGSGDIEADSWEIDEPGFLFGDVYDNLVAGALDNSNAVPSGLNDDVSLALGFDVGELLSGQTLIASMTISDQNIGGLSHTDPNAGFTLFFNGTVELQPIAVPLPSSLFLLALGLMLINVKRVTC